ncbi:AAA domain-containing protein [Arcticibacterium luteifluviistationis]|uniref:AAA domain-containing protein n=1 Tax=Arcticibacterium luteifluviistationis TaxID=1784714 RepID=UPI0013A6C99B|nr:AAA domain-containing protein [Arcticibacterium luteifluviistationis]
MLEVLNNQSIIESLISSKKSIHLCDKIDPRDGKSNAISLHLRKIWKTDKLLKEEKGAEDLYVGYPFVIGKLVDGTPIRCPLLFFPVNLVLEANKWQLEKKDASISFNKTFLLAYSQFNKTFVDEEFFNFNFEEFGDEPTVFLTELYEFLKKSKLEINFNSELFNQKLQSFEGVKKESFDDIKIGELKLESQAVLGIFPQTGSYIAADYDQLLSDGLAKYQGEVQQYLFKENQLKEKTKEEDLHLPFPVDASQEEAIKQIKSGKSLIIEGPPGTGKSQLICNLMADYAADGKKVLLVCQKRAAIDTVHKRLTEIGMAPFSALVHDFQADRKDLYKKIAGQIDNILPNKHANESLNAIFLEREFDATCRKIDQIVRELESYKKALFDSSTYGKSIKEIYLLAEHQTEKYLDLGDSFAFFHFDTLDTYIQNLNSLEKYQTTFYEKDSVAYYSYWQKRKPFTSLTFKDFAEIRNSLKNIVSVKNGLEKLNESFKLETTDEKEIIATYQKSFNSDKAFQNLLKANKESLSLQTLEKLIEEVSEIELPIINENYRDIEKLKEIRDFIFELKTKSSNMMSRLFWNLFTKQKAEAFTYLRDFGFEETPKNFPALLYNLDSLIRLNEIGSEIDQEKQYYESPELLSELNFQKECHLFYEKLDGITLRELSLDKKAAFDKEMKTWQKLLNDIEHDKNIWAKYLSDYQIDTLNSDNFNDIDKYFDVHFDNLCGRDKLYNELTAVGKKCYQLCKDNYNDDYAFHFKQSLFIHFIEALEEKSPILRSVSSLQMELWETELQNLVEKKQKYSTEYLQIKLRENTYKNIEKNRLGNYTTYRDLHHQVTKKRQVWPIRKLLTQFSDELFDLVPCWMASPETVSAIFPLFKSQEFDLVIFDEASQCYAEKGVPAMLRGKQVVIAGDSKQLQPNDLYRIKLDEDLEESPLLETESLLDFASHFLSKTILRGHYRSKTLDLIDFSNQHFYDNKLKLLPNFSELNAGNPGIDFIKVSGVWENNQNQIEAQKVLEVVEIIREYDANKTIGVVTFNFMQADLIQDLTQKIPNLTVKNIENIQGDEFDIVIFSIGYAPNIKGKILMNFGSLNLQGGENRLNVAITRAKEKIKIICSIMPEDLKVENSAHEGPKLLKAYLEYAQKVSKGDFKPVLPNPITPSWNRMLKDEIINSNREFSNELPFADLTKKNEQGYEKLILTDDQLFYAAESIKESFAYLPLMLKTKGWHFQKAWSRNWWIRPLPQLHLLEEKAKKQ